MLRCGEAEDLKIAVHGALGLLMLVCAGYNALAWRVRREPHLAVNAALYGGLTAWEATHVVHHWRER